MLKTSQDACVNNNIKSCNYIQENILYDMSRLWIIIYTHVLLNTFITLWAFNYPQLLLGLTWWPYLWQQIFSYATMKRRHFSRNTYIHTSVCKCNFFIAIYFILLLFTNGNIIFNDFFLLPLESCAFHKYLNLCALTCACIYLNLLLEVLNNYFFYFFCCLHTYVLVQSV